MSAEIPFLGNQEVIASPIRDREKLHALRTQLATVAFESLQQSVTESFARSDPSAFQEASERWIETHEIAITKDIIERLGRLSCEHQLSDIQHLIDLQTESPVQIDDLSEEDTNALIMEEADRRLYGTTNLAYAGIQEAQTTHENDSERVAAIGATIVRDYYFSYILATEQTEDVHPFAEVYTQNLRCIVYGGAQAALTSPSTAGALARTYDFPDSPHARKVAEQVAA